MSPALQLAREAKARKRVERIWAHIEEMRAELFPRCSCDLRPGMTHDELLKLGSGCTAGRWVCPVLDAYRRAVGRPR